MNRGKCHKRQSSLSLCLRMGQLCSTKLCSLTWFPLRSFLFFPSATALPLSPSHFSPLFASLPPRVALDLLHKHTNAHTHTHTAIAIVSCISRMQLSLCVCVCVFNVLGFMFVERTKMTLHWVNKIFVTLRALPASQGRT